MSDENQMGDPDNPIEGPFGLGGLDPAQLMGMFGAMFSGSSHGPVNWDTARQVAAQVATHDPATGELASDPVVPADRAAHVDALVRAAQSAVATATGLAESLALTSRCVTRLEWTTVTLDGLRPVLEALAVRTAGAFGAADSPFGGIDDDETTAFVNQMMQSVTPMMFGMQAGSLAGLLSHHALGQYDLPLPLVGAPQLAFVLSNIERFAHDWELPFDELCFALGARETVHASQRSIAWVRDRLVRLSTAYVDGYELRVDRLADDLPGLAALGDLDASDPMELIARLSSGDTPGLDLDPADVLAAMRTERQLPVLEELQRLGAVLGGYADTVVDTVSSYVGGTAGRIEEALRRHRVERGEAASFVDLMLGLQIDRTHYEAGQAFCAGVVERAGLEGLNRLWERESHLPTASEFSAPGLWLARLELGIGDD